MQPLIFATQPRIAAAAATCLGALGIAIFTADGAILPVAPLSPSQNPNATPDKQAGKGRGQRRRRGRRGGAHVSAADDAGGAASPDTPQKPASSAGSAAPSPSSARTQAVPATHAVSWVVSQLAERVASAGTAGPTKPAAPSDAQRQLLLVLTSMVQPEKVAPNAALAACVLRAMHRLLDSDTTTAAQLPALLDVMLAAMQAAAAAEAGKVLPDILDVFLGWALDAGCGQQSRCGRRASHRDLVRGAAWDPARCTRTCDWQALCMQAVCAAHSITSNSRRPSRSGCAMPHFLPHLRDKGTVPLLAGLSCTRLCMPQARHGTTAPALCAPSWHP